MSTHHSNLIDRKSIKTSYPTYQPPLLAESTRRVNSTKSKDFCVYVLWVGVWGGKAPCPPPPPPRIHHCHLFLDNSIFMTSFSESDGLETGVIALNTKYCYNIPTQLECEAPILVWPKDPGSDHHDSCTCHLGSSPGGQATFNYCYCFNDNFGLTTVMFNFSPNGSVCIVNEGLDLNETIIHFQCSRPLGNHFVKTILELHKIIIAGNIMTQQFFNFARHIMNELRVTNVENLNCMLS